MPQKDYRAYARSFSGIAARAKAHAKYVANRRTKSIIKEKPDCKTLSTAIKNWKTS